MSRARKVKTVQAGLYLVLLGKAMLCISVMLLLESANSFPPGHLLALSVLAGGVVTVGHVLCLLVVPKVQYSPPLVGSFLSNLVGNGMQLYALYADSLWWRLAGLLLKWLSFVLFMAFLMSLAKWLDRTDLQWMASWHRRLFSTGFVLAFLGGPLAFMFVGSGPAMLASPLGLILVVAGLVIYILLIATLAYALGPLGKEPA